MKLKDLAERDAPTLYGFLFGPLEVSRVCHNDGSDKRKAFWVIEVKTEKACVEITAFADGDLHTKEVKERDNDSLQAG